MIEIGFEIATGHWACIPFPHAATAAASAHLPKPVAAGVVDRAARGNPLVSPASARRDRGTDDSWADRPVLYRRRQHPFGNQLLRLQSALARKRADGDTAIARPNVVELFDPVDVDDDIGSRQAACSKAASDSGRRREPCRLLDECREAPTPPRDSVGS